MAKEELIRTDHDANLIVYATETGTHVGVISIEGEAGEAGAVYTASPNARVRLRSVGFSCFGAAEAYIRAIETETRHIDLTNHGRSTLAA